MLLFGMYEFCDLQGFLRHLDKAFPSLTTFNHRTWAEGHAGLDRIAADAPGTALRNEEESFQAFHSGGLGMLVLNALT